MATGDIILELKDFLKKNTVQGLSQARALLYTAESLPLPILNKIIVGEQQRAPTAEEQRVIVEKARQLFELDAQDFVDLDLPLQILKPEVSPLGHLSRFAKIVGDSTTSFWRRREKKTTEFSKKVKNLENFPEYYQRNFHHQTDGYLSDNSAQFYEHQVELLFRGLAAPMRRRMLKPLVRKFKGKKNIKILEVACGTGTFTKDLAQALPEAKITAIDLSPNYIKHAKKRMIDFPNVDFMVGDAENLDFKSESFDGVVSIYLHHELPQKVREAVIVETHRVCKPTGFWGLLDSIQLGDDKELDLAIAEFPKTFHEPFFTNYIKNPISRFVGKKWPQRTYIEEAHLLSKVIYWDVEQLSS